MRLDHDGMRAAAEANLGATADESGATDLVFDKGSMVLAAAPEDMKAAFKRVKKVDGYRWVMINEADLFAANTLSLGSKAGLITPDGKVLKAANLPRRSV